MLLEDAYPDEISKKRNSEQQLPSGFVDSLRTEIAAAKIPAAKSCSSTFFVGSFRDIRSFARKLKEQQDDVSQFLFNKLKPSTREALERQVEGEPLSQSLQLLLVDSVNRIIKDKSIHEPARFSKIPLREETQRLLDKEHREEDLTWLNRMLLEDAYPQEILRAPKGCSMQSKQEPAHRLYMVPLQHIISGNNNLAQVEPLKPCPSGRLERAYLYIYIPDFTWVTAEEALQRVQTLLRFSQHCKAPKDGCAQCCKIDRIIFDRVGRLQARWPLVDNCEVFVSNMVAMCARHHVEIMLVDDTADDDTVTGNVHSRWISVAQKRYPPASNHHSRKRNHHHRIGWRSGANYHTEPGLLNSRLWAPLMGITMGCLLKTTLPATPVF